MKNINIAQKSAGRSYLQFALAHVFLHPTILIIGAWITEKSGDDRYSVGHLVVNDR
jgi:hypothetical protein